MKQAIITALLIFSFIAGRTQSINWKQTHHWKIYALNRTKALSFPVDTLSNFKNVALSDSTVYEYLSRAKLLPKSTNPAWMGFFIASYETTGHRLRKVIFSNYGGFYFDSFTKRYYELPQSLRDDWNTFLSKYRDDLFSPNNN